MALWSGWSLALGVVAVAAAATRSAQPHSRTTLYIGTYTDGASRGIHSVDFDPEIPAFSTPRLVAEAVNPTFFAWHPTRPVLMAVNETDRVGPDGAGGLSSYRVGADGALTLINQVPTGGAGACHLTVDADGRHAFVANYGAGSTAQFDVRDDGTVVEPSSVQRHSGRGPHATRQTRPHAHAIEVAPGGRFVIAIDLGTDALMVHRWDAGTGTLTPHTPAILKTRPGAGPRHIAFHPNGQLAFVINELDSTLTSYAWNGVAGTLTQLSTESTLPRGWRGENTTAEVAVHPSGKFVYASNRGHDSIAIFAAGADGRLVSLGTHSTGGRTPRHFALDATGAWLLAANQESDSIVAFRIDAGTGLLSDEKARVTVPSPVFVGIRPTWSSR
ncbi:MAG TPA: lactonase family protein [Luteitalea sp.]|nr:lactonase family protein [Luteitalea sp.]